MIRRKKATAVGTRAYAVLRLGQRRQVAIPKIICDELGLRRGDFVEVTRSSDHVVIKPKKLVGLAPTKNPLEVSLTLDEEKAVARGFKQLKRGEHVKWDELRNELGM
jgi:AbrB family looped-hinge helix DNA binding protein